MTTKDGNYDMTTQQSKAWWQAMLLRTYCRVQRSRTHGVGVFAVRPIPEGTQPFLTETPEQWPGVPESELDAFKKANPLTEEFWNYVDTMVTYDDAGAIALPESGFNHLPLYCFMNHSADQFNITLLDEKYVAVRDIKAGEELTLNYRDVYIYFEESRDL